MKLLALLILVTLPVFGLDLSINAKSAILIDGKKGQVLYEKEALEPRYPASITKVLTTLIALEEKGEHLDEIFVVSRECVGSISPAEKQKARYTHPSYWIEIASSHVGLKAGEEVSLEMLLHGVMLESGNDASNTLAYAIAGDILTFVEGMNIRAKQIGCKQSYFMNPHGLHHPKHVSCAWDMALIAKEAMRHPYFRLLAKTCCWKKGATNKQEGTIWVQHNQLVMRNKKHYYAKAIGVKTGHTNDACATLIAAAEDQGRELIAVVLGCTNFDHAYRDVTRLFEAAFNEPKVQQCLAKCGEQPFTVEIFRKKGLKTCTKEDLTIEYFPSYIPDVHLEVFWNALEVPIIAEEEVGTLCALTSSGQEIARTPLYAAKGIATPFKFSDIGHLPERVKGGLVASCAGAFLFLAFFRRKRK